MNEISINNNIQAEDLESKLKETTSLTEQQIQEIVPVILNTLSEIKEMERKNAEDTTKQDLSNLTQAIESNSEVSINMRNNKGTVIGAMNFNTITNNISITINQPEIQTNSQQTVDQEVNSQQTVDQEVSSQQTVDQEVSSQQIVNQEVSSQQIVNQEVGSQQTIDQEVTTEVSNTYMVETVEQINIRTYDGFLMVLNKLLEEIEDTRKGISKKGLSKSGKKTMNVEKAKLKQYKEKIKAKKEKIEEAMKKGSTPQIYETDIQQVVTLKSDIDAVRKGVSLGQWGELSNLGSFLYNSPENARKSNLKQENLNEFESRLKEEVKNGAIKHIFGDNEQTAIDFYRRIAEGRYTEADYALFKAQDQYLIPSFKRCGIVIPVAPNLVQINGGRIETVSGSPTTSVDYSNLDRGETFQQGGLAGVVDKALGNCKNMTPGQRNTWKSIAVLGGVAAGIFGLYKFYTSKKMGFWGKAGLTAAAVLGSQIATGEGPISLFNKLLTGGFSKGEFESKFGNAFGDAVTGVQNSGIEYSNTLVPAMYSMMIFNPSTNVGQIRAMTSDFESNENAWKAFRGEAIAKLRNKYGEKSVEHFSVTFTDRFEKEKWLKRLESFGVTDSSADNVKIYEVANNASMNEVILEKFKEQNGLKETSNDVKKKELREYMNNLKVNNQALDMGVLNNHKSDWFENDNEARYTERDEDIRAKKALEDQVDSLSLDDTKKLELKTAVQRFYDERTIESKPNLDKFNLKIDNEGLLVLTSHGGHETKINLNNKSLKGFGNGDGITFTNLSDLLDAADLTNKILESQKGKVAVDIPPFQYKEGRGIYFNNAKGVRNDLISFDWSGTDTRVLSSGPWGASKKIDEIDKHLKDYADYLSKRRKDTNLSSSA